MKTVSPYAVLFGGTLVIAAFSASARAEEITCCYGGKCAPAATEKACQDAALKHRLSRAPAEEPPVEDKFIDEDHGEHFIDLREDPRTVDVKILQCEELEDERRGALYRFCEVALDWCAEDGRSDTELYVWLVMGGGERGEEGPRDHRNPELGNTMSIFPDWRKNEIDGFRVVTFSYDATAQCEVAR